MQALDTLASAFLFPRSLFLSLKAPLFLHLCSYLHNGGRSRVYSRMRARSTGKFLYLNSVGCFKAWTFPDHGDTGHF